MRSAATPGGPLGRHRHPSAAGAGFTIVSSNTPHRQAAGQDRAHAHIGGISTIANSTGGQYFTATNTG
ncbi:hypothetical protein ACFVX3_33085 [Rhodococcus erythropolis]